MIKTIPQEDWESDVKKQPVFRLFLNNTKSGRRLNGLISQYPTKEQVELRSLARKNFEQLEKEELSSRERGSASRNASNNAANRLPSADSSDGGASDGDASSDESQLLFPGRNPNPRGTSNNAAKRPPSIGFSDDGVPLNEGAPLHRRSFLSVDRRSVLDPISEGFDSLPSLSPVNGDSGSPSSLTLSLALDDDTSPSTSVPSSSAHVARHLLLDDHSFAGGAGTDTAALGSISGADSGAPRRSRRAAPSLPFGADLD
ncbi:hypothetical protein EV361DRAFT_150634 [Lentinula raphanica]|nr:hypothetical protein F5880DRAFT_393876 [Lentinula raphanica]KAJ3972331.1 hypothetical protein EV361DRAFT_150634 [Lentinula raphanica]